MTDCADLNSSPASSTVAWLMFALVSAGAPHYGQVRIYATQQDVDALNNAGYNNRETRWDLRNPLSVAANRGLAAHELGPFIREGGATPGARARLRGPDGAPR